MRRMRRKKEGTAKSLRRGRMREDFRVRKCDAYAARGLELSLPTQVVTNEEHIRLPQMKQQEEVEHKLTELADSTARRLGVNRGQSLATSGGMAVITGLPAPTEKMNVLPPTEMVETRAEIIHISLIGHDPVHS